MKNTPPLHPSLFFSFLWFLGTFPPPLPIVLFDRSLFFQREILLLCFTTPIESVHAAVAGGQRKLNNCTIKNTFYLFCSSSTVPTRSLFLFFYGIVSVNARSDSFKSNHRFSIMRQGFLCLPSPPVPSTATN